MSKVEMLRCVLREKHSCAEANGISVTPPPPAAGRNLYIVCLWGWGWGLITGWL